MRLNKEETAKRLEEVKEALTVSDIKANVLARYYEQDTEDFRAWFKRHAGMTITEFRKENQKFPLPVPAVKTTIVKFTINSESDNWIYLRDIARSEKVYDLPRSFVVKEITVSKGDYTETFTIPESDVSTNEGYRFQLDDIDMTIEFMAGSYTHSRFTITREENPVDAIIEVAAEITYNSAQGTSIVQFEDLEIGDRFIANRHLENDIWNVKGKEITETTTVKTVTMAGDPKLTKYKKKIINTKLILVRENDVASLKFVVPVKGDRTVRVNGYCARFPMKVTRI